MSHVAGEVVELPSTAAVRLVRPDYDAPMASEAPTATEGDPWNLHAALGGDRAAWRALIDEFAETVWQWARRIGLSREDAEDVCQSVWFLLKDRGDTIEDPRRLPGWLATTTRYEALAVARKRSRQRQREESLAESAAGILPAGDPGPAEMVVHDEVLSALVASFETLSQKCRELLPLLWDRSLSYAEISEILETPIGSIGPMRKRCLDALRVGAQT